MHSFVFIVITFTTFSVHRSEHSWTEGEPEGEKGIIN